jgi:hypothetical protein
MQDAVLDVRINQCRDFPPSPCSGDLTTRFQSIVPSYLDSCYRPVQLSSSSRPMRLEAIATSAEFYKPNFGKRKLAHLVTVSNRRTIALEPLSHLSGTDKWLI